MTTHLSNVCEAIAFHRQIMRTCAVSINQVRNRWQRRAGFTQRLGTTIPINTVSLTEAATNTGSELAKRAMQ